LKVINAILIVFLLFSVDRIYGSTAGMAIGMSHLYSDEANCITQKSIPVNEDKQRTQILNELAAIVTYSKTDVKCFGDLTGSIDITVTGAVGSVSYLWADGFVTEDRVGLAAGTYTVTVTDDNGPIMQSIGITQPAVLSAAVTSASITCNSANDGTITISAPTGGSGTYEYSINGGTSWQPGGNFTGLSNGTYIVKMRDAACTTCMITLNNALVITRPPVLTISSISSNSPICGGSTLNLTVTAGGGTGSYSYAWTGPNSFSSTSQNPAIANSLPAASGTYFLTVTDANGCSASANTAALINPTPAVNDPANQVVCNGSSTAAIIFTGSATSYTWTNNSPSIGLTASGTGNISPFSAVNSGNSDAVATIQVTPVYSAGGIDCTGTPKSFTITVKPTPAVTAAPLSQTVCSGSAPSVNLTSNVPGTTFAWTVVQSGVSGASNGSGPNISQTLTATGTSVGTATYTITPTNNGCVGTPVTDAISVIPIPAVNLPLNQLLCNNVSTAAVNFTGTIPGTTFSWTNDSPGIGLAASGNGDITSFLATNTGIANVIATIAVTPHLTVGGVTCDGPAANFTITVKPAPIVTAPSDKTYCNGELTTVIPLTGTPSGVVYDITGGASIGLTNRTGVTEIPVYTAIKNTAVISITPRANGCTGTTVFFNVTVNPIPNVSGSPVAQTICSQGTTNIVISSTAPGATFSWTVGAILPAGSVTGASASIGNSIIQTLTNLTSNNATVTYDIVPTANGCSGSPMHVVITVKPTPNLVINNPAPVCTPNTVDLTAPGITTGSTPGLTLSYWTDAAATISFASPMTAGTGTYYIKGVDPVTGCYAVKSVMAAVNPTPSLVITNPAPVCAPGTVNLTVPAVTAGSTPGLTFTYWSDAAATIPYATPLNAVDDTYYIRGTTASGCSDLKPVIASVYSTLGIPVFTLGASSGICKGSLPITYSATATNNLSLTYSLDATSLAAGNTINSLTGLVTFAAGWTGTSQITATATGCGAPTQAIHAVTVNDLPSVSLVASPSTPVCEGVPVTLTATNSGGSTTHTVSGSSGNINLNIPDDSNLSYAYPTITLSGSGATLTSADEIMVTVNINHTQDRDLDIFLVDPSGTKAILLSSDNGGTGDNYTSTVFRTLNAVNPITGGTAPFTGTFLPEGSITTAPDRTGAAGGSNYNAVIPASSLNNSSIDGTWSLRVFDDGGAGNVGTIVNWSLSITKQTGSGFGSMVNGPPTIGPVSYSGAFNTTATAVVTPPAGTNNYTVTTTDGNGCSATSNQVAVVVNPTPNATIVADYCSNQPKIKLTSTGTGTYLWSTGEVTNPIFVDIAAIYSVTVTNTYSCSSTASYNVADEKVVNGSFEAGNSDFTSSYGYRADNPSVNTELATGGPGGGGEGLYGVGVSGQNYHGNFWGRDHTTGNGNFMLVNGWGNTYTIWQEGPIAILPNTDYYFSAWALSLNNVGPYAQLRFEIETTNFGKEQVGSTALLTAGSNANNNPWKPQDRFYGMWQSRAATSVTIRIINLETVLNGNDFGLDDISFGTLAPLPGTINPGVAAAICEGSTINLTANVTGGKAPFTYAWTGPNGFTSSVANPAIPNATTANSGEYTLTFTDGYGCTPLVQKVTTTVGIAATVNAGSDQSVCASSPSVGLAGAIGGSAISGTWSGGTGTFTPGPTTLNAVYTAGPADIASGSVNLILTATNDPASVCPVVSDQVKITYFPVVTANINSSSGPLCNGGSDGFATASGSGGTGPYLYSWNTIPVQTTATANNLSAGTYIVTVTDSHGCSDTETITLSEPPALVVDDNILTTEVSCYGGNNGTARVTVISGASPTFLWSNGQTTPTATGLSAGIYTITVTSANGCSATALTVFITQPDAPTIACPNDITVQADAGFTYASNVPVPAPVYTNDCPMTDRIWNMSGATTGSSPLNGIHLLVSHNFNVGITTIGYTITDGTGNIRNCTFNVTVTPNDPPVITCPTAIIQNADPGFCSAVVAIIPATATGSGVTVVGVRSDGLPLTDPYPVGSVTITWTATNASGTVFCTQLITVIDNIKPTFTPPAPLTACVESLITAIYNAATMDINPDRPDYFPFVSGNTALDLNPATFSDNCPLSCAVQIRWKIDMHDGSRIPALPAAYQTGQPSTFGSDIHFLGDGVTFTNLVHTITYWIVDCAGNVSDPVTQTITIRPRPNIVKIN